MKMIEDVLWWYLLQLCLIAIALLIAGRWLFARYLEAGGTLCGLVTPYG